MHLAFLSLIVLFCLSFFSYLHVLSLTHAHGSLSLSLSLSLSPTYHVLFATTHSRAPTVPLPSSKSRIFFTDKIKKICSTNRKRLPAPRMFSFPKKKKKKEKKSKEQPKLHDLVFLLILLALSQRFFLQLQREKLAFVPLPSKSLSFFTNKKKNKN